MALRRGCHIPTSVALIALSAAMLAVVVPLGANALSTSMATVPGSSNLLIDKAERLEGGSIDSPYSGGSLEEDEFPFHRKTVRSLMNDIARYRRERSRVRSMKPQITTRADISQAIQEEYETAKEDLQTFLYKITKALRYFTGLSHREHVEEQSVDPTIQQRLPIRPTQVETMRSEALENLETLLGNIVPNLEKKGFSRDFAQGIAYLLSELTVEESPGSVSVITVKPYDQHKLRIIGDQIATTKGSFISIEDFFSMIVTSIPPAAGNVPTNNFYKICERINEQTQEAQAGGIVADYEAAHQTDVGQEDPLTTNNIVHSPDNQVAFENKFQPWMDKEDANYASQKKHLSQWRAPVEPMKALLPANEASTDSKEEKNKEDLCKTCIKQKMDDFKESTDIVLEVKAACVLYSSDPSECKAACDGTKYCK